MILCSVYVETSDSRLHIEPLFSNPTLTKLTKVLFLPLTVIINFLVLAYEVEICLFVISCM